MAKEFLNKAKGRGLDLDKNDLFPDDGDENLEQGDENLDPENGDQDEHGGEENEPNPPKPPVENPKPPKTRGGGKGNGNKGGDNPPKKPNEPPKKQPPKEKVSVEVNAGLFARLDAAMHEDEDEENLKYGDKTAKLSLTVDKRVNENLDYWVDFFERRRHKVYKRELVEQAVFMLDQMFEEKYGKKSKK